MKVDDGALAAVIDEFAALSGPDRRAILRLLSPSERLAVTKRRRLRGAAAAGKHALCSPWLARRLKALLESPSPRARAVVTDQTRKAVRKLLAAPPSGGDTPIDPLSRRASGAIL